MIDLIGSALELGGANGGRIACSSKAGARVRGLPKRVAGTRTHVGTPAAELPWASIFRETRFDVQKRYK